MGAKRRIVPAVVIVIASIAMFVVPSAYAIERGAPRWLALVVGVLAFPIAPVGWHLFAEWRRKRRAPSSSTLTPWDRALLRFAVVAVVALGGTIAIGRAAAWTAVKHHALWFTDWSEPDPIADSELLARIPADAEIVVWIRPLPTQHALLPMALSGQAEIAIVLGKDEQMVLIAGGDAVLAQLEAMTKLGTQSDKLARIEAPSGMLVMTTPGWRTAVAAPPPALIQQLYRAPADASAIVAGAPSAMTKRYPARTFAAWARVGDDRVYFAAVAEVVDDKGADKLVKMMAAWRAHLAASKDCGNRAFANMSEPSLIRTGTQLTGSLELAIEHVREIPRCMTSQGF